MNDEALTTWPDRIDTRVRIASRRATVAKMKDAVEGGMPVSIQRNIVGFLGDSQQAQFRTG